MTQHEILKSVVGQLDEIRRHQDSPTAGLIMEVETSEDECALVGSSFALIQFAREIIRVVAESDSVETGWEIDGAIYFSIPRLFDPRSEISISCLGVREFGL